MRLEQQRTLRVPLEVASLAGTPTAAIEAQLRRFLSRPIRPLRGLLDPSRLEAVGSDRYVYQSRPYGVVGWTLQPQVLLRARWDGQCLAMEQLEARVHGLGEWQERLHFGLSATIRPLLTADDPQADAAGVNAQLEAAALVWAELPRSAAVLVTPVLQLALQQLLDRLERRCQRGLRRRAELWLDRPRKHRSELSGVP